MHRRLIHSHSGGCLSRIFLESRHGDYSPQPFLVEDSNNNRVPNESLDTTMVEREGQHAFLIHQTYIALKSYT